MTTITTGDALGAALQACQGGETLLVSGIFPSWVALPTVNPATPVTIASADPANPATIPGLEFDGCSNLISGT
jgi:hypothetical protein